jgi:D-alanine-D-alanine ligase
VSALRRKVGIVYGGRSAEREVSLVSARNVAAALDPDKYELALIGIDASGRWSLGEPERAALPPGANRPALASAHPVGRAVSSPGSEAALRGIDVLFPLLHGPNGEDGSIQGFARLAGLPCVGPDLLASALCMDKDAAKRILRESGIDSAPFMAFTSIDGALSARDVVLEALGWDLFVKPANLGSSVGVSRARTDAEYQAALELAFRYDAKVIVERRIEGREIEVAVLGHRELRASVPGEIRPRTGFYSYDAKYLDEDGAELIVPAELSEREAEACRKLALEACRALCVDGMARADLFLPPDGRPLVNEVNTIPGFTARSMYPLLWEASGLPLGSLVDELIEIALRSHSERSALISAPPAISSGL